MAEMTMTGRRPGRRAFSLIFIMLFVGLMTVASTSFAKEKRNPKIIELEGIDVIGKVAKPQVFYVLGRSTVRYEQLKLDQSFVQRIVETARKNPF